MSDEKRHARISVAWWVACVALIAPLLRSRFFLTQDGPTHLYNARILLDRLRGDWEPYAGFFELNLTSEPNWFTHAALAASLVALPPWLAEKTLLLGYVLLFAFGFRYLARSVGGSPLVALLAVPFSYNVPLQMGFFNFAFSIAFFPWVVGWWWRHAEHWTFRHTLGLTAALLILYFCHPVGLVLTGLTLLFAWLVGRKGQPRVHLAHLVIAGLPPLILLLTFLGRHGGVTPGGERTLGVLVLMLITNTTLVLLANRELFVGVALALFMGVALVVGVITRFRDGPRAGVTGAPVTVFGTLAAVAVLLFFIVPDRIGGGLYMTMRLQLWPWLLLTTTLAALPWGRKGERILATGAIVALLVLTGMRWSGYGIVAEDLELHLAASEDIAEGAVVLPLSFDHSGHLERTNWSSAYIHWFLHATHYIGAERPVVFLNNYEASQGYFPLRWREGLDPEGWMHELGVEPPCVDLPAFESETGVQIEQVLIWGLPDTNAVNECGRALLSGLEDRPVTSGDDGWMRVFAVPAGR